MMLKLMSIFLFIITRHVCELHDYQLEDWTDLNPSQCIEFSQQLSANDHAVTVKQAKTQTDNPVNHVAVFSHDQIGDCLCMFSLIEWNHASPIQDLDLPLEIVQGLQAAVSPIRTCSHDDIRLLFAVVLGSVDRDQVSRIRRRLADNSADLSSEWSQNDMDSIPNELEMQYVWSESVSEDSQQIPEEHAPLNSQQSPWADIDDDNLFLLSNKLNLDQVKFQLAQGRIQSGVVLNYALTVRRLQMPSSVPCFLTVSVCPWKNDGAFDYLDADFLTTQGLAEQFGGFAPCDEQTLSLILATANNSQQILTQSKLAEQMVGIWDPVSEGTLQVLGSVLALNELGLNIVSRPKFEITSYIRYGMVVQDSLKANSVLFVRMSFAGRTLQVEDMSTNPTLEIIAAKQFLSHFPCSSDLNLQISSQLNGPVAYKLLARTFVEHIDHELRQLAGKPPFVGWSLLDMEQVFQVDQLIQSEGKSVQPISGMFKSGQTSEFVLIMMDQYLDPCTLYLQNVPASRSNSFSNLSDNDLTMLILENVTPCSEEAIAEYAENRRRVII
ncbi:MAG: hypothetical protein AAF349_19120 [Cyanobacteria bacterium P01_A01_bin.68]